MLDYESWTAEDWAENDLGSLSINSTLSLWFSNDPMGPRMEVDFYRVIWEDDAWVLQYTHRVGANTSVWAYVMTRDEATEEFNILVLGGKRAELEEHPTA